MLINKKYLNYFYFLILVALISGPAIPDIIMTLLSIITIFYLYFYKKNYELDLFYKLIFVYLIILFTTFFSNYFENSFIGFSKNIRYFIYLYSFYLFFDTKFLKIYFYIISLLILFITIDLFIQYNFGSDIFGFKPDLQVNKQRLNGPFDDEYIAGTYLYKISIPLIGYLLYKLKYKLSFFFIFLCLIAIIFTGERMALLLFIFSLFLILIFLKKFKLLFLISLLILITLIFSYFNFSQVQFKMNEFFYAIIDFKNSGHGAHYLAAWTIFLENPIIGSGFRTFREVCSEDFVNLALVNKTIAPHCTTHPHNIYLEALSDTGLVGFIGLLFMIFIFSNKVIKEKLYQNEYVGFVALFISIFWPLSSNGNIFNNWNSCLNLTLIGVLLINSKKTA